MTAAANMLSRLRLPAVVLALVVIIVESLSHALPGPGLLDFGSFIASGRAARERLDPYGVYPLSFHVVFPGFESWNRNLNPPISVPVFALFDRLNPHAAFRLWWAVSLVGYAAAVLLLVRRYARDGWLVPTLWAFALAGFWDTLVLGQIYVPLVLAAVGAWLLLERRDDIAAGVLIGIVVAVKPNFAVWPGLLLLAGHRRPALSAAATAVLLSLVPVALYGPEIYRQWLDVIAANGGGTGFLTNASLAALALRLDAGAIGLALGAALLAAMALWAWRARPAPLAASALGLIGAVAASPIAWVHYTLFLLPVFFAHRSPSLPMRVAALLLLVPVPTVLRFMDAPQWQQVTIGSSYAWAVVLCLVAVLMDPALARWTRLAPAMAPSRLAFEGETRGRS